MMVSDFGDDTSVNALHPLKAQLPMKFTLIGMCTSLKFTHPSNAESPTLSVCTGKKILRKMVLPFKKRSGITGVRIPNMP